MNLEVHHKTPIASHILAGYRLLMPAHLASFSRAFICVAALFLASCSSNDRCANAPKVNADDVQLNYTPIHREIKAIKDAGQAQAVIEKYPVFFEHFYDRSQLPSDSVIVIDLLATSTNPYVDTLYMDVDKHFGDLDGLKADLKGGLANLKHYYPDAKVPHLYTIVGGYAVDVFIRDTTLVWGLDYFLGKAGKYEPPMVPRYIQRRMEKPYMVPTTMQFISNQYNKVDMLDNTMLAEMIQWGKSYYFIENMLPCTADSILIGYTSKEWNESNEELSRIWAHFIKFQLFYETDHTKKQRYMGERPFVSEIGNDCPGRIGRFLGWLIVRKYAERTGLSLQEVMQEMDSRKIFEESKFRP